MKRRLHRLAIAALVLVAVLAAVAVWTGDVRWGYTAMIVGGATAAISAVIGAVRWPL